MENNRHEMKLPKPSYETSRDFFVARIRIVGEFVRYTGAIGRHITMRSTAIVHK